MKKISTPSSLIIALVSSVLLLASSANAQDIKLTRYFDPPVVTPGSTITVHVFLDKGYRGGVARLDEFIPPGFTATEGDDNGSKFSVNDTILKFSWEDMPPDPGFTVSYQLHVPATALGNYTMVAQFIYVTSNGAAAAYFKPYTLVVQNAGTGAPAVMAAPAKDSAKPIAPVVSKNLPVQISTPVPVAVKIDSVPAKPVVKKIPAVVSSKPIEIKQPTTVAPKVTALPKTKTAPPSIADTAKRNGLYYRVQIMASAERLNVDSVIINGIRDKLYIITKNGISRYYIGAFHALQPALDYRNRIVNNGLKGPFVVAYKDGQKITIKESLQVVATN